MTSTSTTNLNHCQHCGNYHTGQCPRVKAIEYYANGTVKRVEFFGPGDYSQPIYPVKPIYPTLPTQTPKTDWVPCVGGTGSTDSLKIIQVTG